MNKNWRCVDCISDLHLHSGDARTFAAFRQYLATTPADALFILGDWFEVWVGDDVLESGDTFITECVAAIRRAAQRIAAGYAGFEAEAEIKRADWGLTWNAAIEGGGVLVSDKIKIVLDVQLLKQA